MDGYKVNGRRSVIFWPALPPPPPVSESTSQEKSTQDHLGVLQSNSSSFPCDWLRVLGELLRGLLWRPMNEHPKAI